MKMVSSIGIVQTNDVLRIIRALYLLFRSKKTTSASPPPSANNNCTENSSSANNINETTTSTFTSAGLLEVSFKSSSIGMDLSSCRDEALKIIDEVLSENNMESQLEDVTNDNN